MSAHYLLRPLEFVKWHQSDDPEWGYVEFCMFTDEHVLDMSSETFLRCPGGVCIDYPWRREGQYGTFQQGRARAVEDLAAVNFEHPLRRWQNHLDHLIDDLRQLINKEN